jgi:peroxiredoxin
MVFDRVRRLFTLALMLTALPAAIAADAPSPAVSALAGRWDATVNVNGVEIPFPFEIARREGALVGSFFNGDRRISSTSGQIDGDHVVFTFAQYGTTLEASVSGGRLNGEYRRAAAVVYPFTAVPAGRAQRGRGAASAPSIDGTWIVKARSSKGEAAWRFIAHHDGDRVSATILRVDGDTGTLTGAFEDGRYVLSHFSGARPLLLEVTPRNDGTLELRENRRIALQAVRASDPRASSIGAPSDPERHTTVRDSAEPFEFHFPDLAGRMVSNTDQKFANKVVLVSISGSWCPNCHDEAPFLAALYRKYRGRGLEIVTISFEEKDELANPRRLRAFIETYGFQHTVLLAGEPDTVAAKIPQAVNLDAFPTSFILGRDGRVRAVHAGFPSPGSREFFRKAENDVSGEIERLLDERPSEEK